MSTVESAPPPPPLPPPTLDAAPGKPPKGFDGRASSSSSWAFLRVPVRADRARRAVLVQLSRSLQDFQGFSTRWYETFFETEALRDSLVASLEIALLTMVVATVLGTMLAYGWRAPHARVGQPQRAHARAAGDAEIVAGASALLPFTQVKLDLSLTMIILAHITFSISYVTVVVRARLVLLSREVEDASMDLGATRVKTFRLVTLPALWPAVPAAGLLVFALSFDDFVLSFFTTGESPQPLPVRIWTQIRFGVRPTINAIGTFMLVIWR